ncbi:MAG: hypothetical protein RDU14_11700 [Melioribacteraceae bacterium]|nr:hypothetical protein [Melioribacteraceae bacterium]
MKKQINLFLVGTGLVGKALLKSIKINPTVQSENRSITIKVAGIANRSNMLLGKRGIDPVKWKSELNNNGGQTNIKSFIELMKRMKLPNSIFVDCTDGNDIVTLYNTILKTTPIVTPNKSANAGSYKQYNVLKDIVRKNGTDFRYSANVGVGVPSLDVIKSILSGGDKIVAIEGLFSSTMNYLLDKLMTTNKKFSDLLKEAEQKGLTEPDPRNDLNGIDTARKILILVRDSGVKLELSDVKIENLVPVILRNIKSLDRFYESLKIYDKKFDELKKEALRKNCKLVYSANYRKNSASVKIEMVDTSHPFYFSSSKEKVVLFYTKFYKKHPLIIKGQSGGAKAAAAVLVSDILKTIK